MVKTSNHDGLLKYVNNEDYKLIVVVLDDLSTQFYYKDKDTNISNLGILGFAFTSQKTNIRYLQWLRKDYNTYHIMERDYKEDFLLHHTVKAAVGNIKEMLSLTEILGGDRR